VIDIKRTGPPPGPGPRISHHEVTDPGQGTAPWRLTLPVVPLRYGRDYPGSDAWADRDGRVHHGDGPFLNRPWRRLRRAVSRWLR